MIAGDLVTYLDALISETGGSTLFEGPPPELPTDLVAVTHYGGEAALDRVMGPSLTAPGVEVGLVQVFVRNASMATAKTKAEEIHALLDNYSGTIGSRTYFQIESVDGRPYSLGQDARGLWRFVANYRVQHER